MGWGIPRGIACGLMVLFVSLPHAHAGDDQNDQDDEEVLRRFALSDDEIADRCQGAHHPNRCRDSYRHTRDGAETYVHEHRRQAEAIRYFQRNNDCEHHETQNACTDAARRLHDLAHESHRHLAAIASAVADEDDKTATGQSTTGGSAPRGHHARAEESGSTPSTAPSTQHHHRRRHHHSETASRDTDSSSGASAPGPAAARADDQGRGNEGANDLADQFRDTMSKKAEQHAAMADDLGAAPASNASTFGAVVPPQGSVGATAPATRVAAGSVTTAATGTDSPKTPAPVASSEPVVVREFASSGVFSPAPENPRPTSHASRRPAATESEATTGEPANVTWAGAIDNAEARKDFVNRLATNEEFHSDIVEKLREGLAGKRLDGATADFLRGALADANRQSTASRELSGLRPDAGAAFGMNASETRDEMSRLLAQDAPEEYLANPDEPLFGRVHGTISRLVREGQVKRPRLLR
jgi:hypothetical protein